MSQDGNKLVAIYRDRFGIPTEVQPPGDHNRMAICTAPSGGKIELHAPLDDSTKAGRFVAEGRSGLFAIVHESDDPESTASAIRANGVGVEQSEPGFWDIDPAATFGARLRVRQSTV